MKPVKTVYIRCILSKCSSIKKNLHTLAIHVIYEDISNKKEQTKQGTRRVKWRHLHIAFNAFIIQVVNMLWHIYKTIQGAEVEFAPSYLKLALPPPPKNASNTNMKCIIDYNLKPYKSFQGKANFISALCTLILYYFSIICLPLRKLKEI